MSISVPTKRQHTVSQVVLRQFAADSLLSLYDGDAQRFIKKGPRAAFHIQFDRYDPFGAEDLWGETEKYLPKMYRALASRTALGNPEVEDLIRKVVALHWARSSAMRAAHKVATEKVKQRSIEGLAQNPDFLRRAMYRLTGLHASGEQALQWFNEQIHERAVAESSEEWWSERNAIHFGEAQKKMAKWEVQIGYAPTASDFIISDAPVVTLKRGHDGVGPHQGVALGDAIEICMPLGSNVMVRLGPAPKELDLVVDAVNRYNDLQKRARIRWLGCRPGGPSDRDLRASLPVWTSR